MKMPLGTVVYIRIYDVSTGENPSLLEIIFLPTFGSFKTSS